MNFINDCVSDRDLLGYLPYIESFEYLIDNQNELMNLPVVFGIHGKWGVGKSTFMELIKKRLIDSKNHFIVSINPWEYANEKNFVSVFLAELFKATENSLYNDEKEKQDDIIAFLKSICKPLKLSTNLGLVKAEYDFSKLTIDAQKEMIDKYITENYAIKETIHKILKADILKDYKIVVFIDDLDRCPEDKVMEVLESIKLILNCENCIFFIGCDKDYLESALAIKYEQFIRFIVNESYNAIENIEGSGYKKSFKRFSKEYLEKIIQVPFYIPPLDEKAVENYIESLLNPNEKEIKIKKTEVPLYKKFKDKLNVKLASKLFLEKKLNPRKIKRILNLIFLNFLFITFKCGDDFINDVDINLLIILGILRDEYSEYYRKFISSEVLGERTFRGIFAEINNKNANDNEDDKTVIKSEFTKDNDINTLFCIFFKECKINSNKKLDEVLKNIGVMITISNVTASEKYENNDWGEIGDIKSKTGTNKTLKLFLDRLKSDTKILDFVLWFFDNIYKEENNYLGISINVHFYKESSNNNHLDNFILKLQYDEFEKKMLIKFESGKYLSIINNLKAFESSKLYNSITKTIVLDQSVSTDEIEQIKKILINEISKIYEVIQ